MLILTSVWLGILPRLFLFEGFVLTESPAGGALAMWMRDSPISKRSLLIFFGHVFASAERPLINSFTYSRVDEAD